MPPIFSTMRPTALGALVISCLSACSVGHNVANSHPGRLVRPLTRPLSAVAQVGRAIFLDSSLSASGQMSCATCHDPAYAYGPTPNAPLRTLAQDAIGVTRSVPSLRYLYRSPDFSIGPELNDADAASAPSVPNSGGARPAKAVATRPDEMVPQGGLFWDGRASTLQDQAMGPLTNPAEMANRDVRAASDRLSRAPYAARLRQLFGDRLFATASRAVDEAMFAVARFQIEDSSFHPYDSKYDDYLEGKTSLTAAEARGLRAFEDTAHGNCASCHTARPTPDGLPPLFTDHQYEALGVPRNMQLAANHVATRFDLGLCGPLRVDLHQQTQYCGMFGTPSLRNVAARIAFFHNGVYQTLEEVVAFYALRDSDPDSIYRRADNTPDVRFNDLPARYRGNVDTIDHPFTGQTGGRSLLTRQEREDIVAFLRTLTDGYRRP
jgi:cytochrome c peroxidase